ncbi:hypothetical protein ARSEF1564_009699 [Beauveria bassiana]
MIPVPGDSLPVNPAQNDEYVQYPEPLKLSGALDQFEFEETTPVIGREYAKLNIVDSLLNAPNADKLVRDLAITISQRGVVFFRAQHNLTDAMQKQLTHLLGQLSGNPADSTLHIHPLLRIANDTGSDDVQVSTLSSLTRKKIHPPEQQRNKLGRRYDAAQWHADTQFERAPAGYTSLRLTQLPETGGDTLWASGCEIYDRFSKPYQKFFEGLSATFSAAEFLKLAAADPERVPIYDQPRGSPLNIGRELTAVHPIVRTNPVTGWKSIYSIGPFPKCINELNFKESDELLEKFYSTIVENHDLTVRFKWRNENDFAIWDNRSTFHTATFDYEGLGERFGHRVVGIGEKPYLDPNSLSRTEALAAEGV